MDEYVEKGGLAWGPCLTFGILGNCYASWPFATLRISKQRIRLEVKCWKIFDEIFQFQQGEVDTIRVRRTFPFGASVTFEHRNTQSPMRMRFFTFWKRKPVLQAFRRLGYTVVG